MTEILPSPEEIIQAAKEQKTPWKYAIVVVVFGIIIVGLLLISRFNNNDYVRDVQSWKEKLNLIAENRKEDVSRFVSGNFSELRTLADNPSLKLYLTELQMIPQTGNKDSGNSELSQKSYLRNLLIFTAQRAGFVGINSIDSIPANVVTDSKSGIAIVDDDNQIVVSTQIINSSVTKVLEHAKKQEPGTEGLIELQKDSDGALYMGFSVPIYSIQGEHNAAGQIGRIVAIKTIGDNLFGLLKQPGATEKTLETLLLRMVEDTKDKMEYISPLLDGSEALVKKVQLNPKENAEAYITSGKDNFSSELGDYREQAVLATSRDISGTNWKLIVKVDKDEAFSDSGAHRAALVTSFTLIIAVIVLIIIAMWWYAYSRHALMASSYFKKVAIQAQAQENLLRLVTDYQPEAIYILDANQRYWFANKKVAEESGMSLESIDGKTVSDVQGAIHSERISEKCSTVIKSGIPAYEVHKKNSNGNELVIRSGYVPIKEIPVSNLPPKTSGVLIVEQDVSEVYYERERRLSTQKQLVQTLLNLVDKRDPFAANHSLLVSKISYQIASDMELDSVTVEATRTAASLMNIGKIVVPTELLTKTGQLNEEEKNIIRHSMDTASSLLEKVSFDGPVAEILKQWQERWNGAGPLGLKGEKILMPARIIAVANSFIGMISPRSWRDAMSIEAANKFLLDNSGNYFDQRVVITLIHYVDNQDGRKFINSILQDNKSKKTA
ncbi:MAG: HD domain-containing phosphohydrolase [Rickettsiales bacterium]